MRFLVLLMSLAVSLHAVGKEEKISIPIIKLQVKDDKQRTFNIKSHIAADKNGEISILANIPVGNIPVGASSVFVGRMGPCCSDQSFGALSLSGDPEFTVTSNSCTGLLSQGQNCSFEITFTPTTVGTKNASFSISYTNIDPITGIPTGGGSFHSTLIGTSYRNVQRCEAKEKGSVIGVDGQTLGEVVPVIGTNLNLHYSSIYSPEYSSDTSNLYDASQRYSFNQGGWTNSLHHFYSNYQRRLYKGTGQVAGRFPHVITGGNLLVASSSEDEVYIFSPEGQHLETRTYLTGALKYSFAYDGSDRLTSITDAFGNQTVFTRDSFGLVTSITSPYGQVTTLTYDAAGLVESITNPKSETYSMTYKTGTGLLETFTKPGGQTSTFTYDTNARLIKDLGHSGNFWELIAGTGGSLTKSSKLGRSTTYSLARDATDLYTRVETDPTGWQTASDELGSYSSISTPASSSSVNSVPDERYGFINERPSNISLSMAGYSRTTTISQSLTYPTGVTPEFYNFLTLTKTITTAGKSTTEVFNKTTGVITTTSPEGATSSVTLNSHEQPVSMKVGADTPTTMSYDTNGRLSSSTQGTAVTNYAYSTTGNLSSITNPLSQVTTFGYDLAGRVTSVTLPDLRVIGYSYNSNGQLTGVTPPGRPIHSFTFNAAELVSAYQPPTLSGVTPVNTQYTYNDDKQLTQITRPTGQTVTMGYGSTTGLLTSMTLPTGSFSYTYVANSPRLFRVDSPDGLRNEYSYWGDKSYLTVQKDISTGTTLAEFAYNFDSQFRVNSKTMYGYARGWNHSYNITYNDDDKPTQVGMLSLSYEYPSGRLSETTFGTITDSRTYDSFGNIQSYEAIYTPTGGGTPVSLYSYTLTRDALRRITEKTETIQGVTSVYKYSYDVAGRLETVLKDSLPYSSYVYDSNGNRISGTTAGVAFTATYDNQDRMLTYGGRSYTYNNNGDMIQRTLPSSGGSYDFEYDALGNLKEITFPTGGVQALEYDGEQRFSNLKVNGSLEYRLLYETPYRVAARQNNSGGFHEVYVHATHINTPDYFFKNGSRHRIITDHLGSVRLVVAPFDGAVLQRIDYDDLGGVISDTNPGYQTYGFAGGIYLRHSGLVKFGARMYDAHSGRWLTKDPILFEGGDTNLYGYVLQDPVNWVDPDGLKISFRDSASERAFNNLRNSSSLSRANRIMLDELERSSSDISIGQGDPGQCPGPGVYGRTSGYKGNTNSDIELWTGGSSPFDQSVLLHELVHAYQIMRDSPVVEGPAYDVSDEFLRRH